MVGGKSLGIFLVLLLAPAAVAFSADKSDQTGTFSIAFKGASDIAEIPVVVELGGSATPDGSSVKLRVQNGVLKIGQQDSFALSAGEGILTKGSVHFQAHLKEGVEGQLVASGTVSDIGDVSIRGHFWLRDNEANIGFTFKANGKLRSSLQPKEGGGQPAKGIVEIIGSGPDAELKLTGSAKAHGKEALIEAEGTYILSGETFHINGKIKLVQGEGNEGKLKGELKADKALLMLSGTVRLAADGKSLAFRADAVLKTEDGKTTTTIEGTIKLKPSA